MKPSTLTQTALLAALLAAATAAQAEDAKPAKEKCYGVSKVGENSCAAANGSHSCSGQSKVAFSGQEWKEVLKGSCALMSGSLTPYDGTNPKKTDDAKKG